jgi:hypothetical protein
MADDYLERVEQSYQGEVFGEAIFRELAAKCGDPETTYKWRVLEQLERETKERLKPLVAELGGDLEEDPTRFSQGQHLAAKWAKQSWDEIMLWFRDELPGYVRFFENLEADARDQDRELLGKVTAHERALLDFAEHEIAGRGDRSLEPVLALLDRPPRRDA